MRQPKRAATVVALLAMWIATPASAQFWVAWHRSPTITVVANGDDARVELVEEAVAFWNKTLADNGSPFRLNATTRVDQPIPEEDLKSLSRSIVETRGAGRPSVPDSLRAVPGDITIYLAHSAFVSFASPFYGTGRRVVGIRNLGFPPLSLPNVARNLVAHELGHAIGLGHSADPTLLMCGRPASCRPVDFQSKEPRMFALSEDELQRLLAMYPKEWMPR